MNPSPELISILQSIWAAPGVKIIGAHVLLNTALAIAASMRTGEFKLWRLADFLYKKMLPLCLTYYAAQSLGDAAGLAGVGATTWAAIQAALLGDTLNSLQELGLRLPNVVENVTDKASPMTRTFRRLEAYRAEQLTRDAAPDTARGDG